MASSALNQVYDEARQAEMLRQARQHQLVSSIELGYAEQPRSWLQRARFWRQRKTEEVPAAAPAATPR
jgi:hypothetical protein